MGEPLNESNRISIERIDFYQNKAEKLLEKWGSDFEKFVEGNEKLVEIGDELLRTYETTGFNILHSRSSFPITSNKPLIIYNNYTGRTNHFGSLLAEMERSGIVYQDQIRFGVKASRVLYGDWEIDEINEQIVEFQRRDAQGGISYDKVSQTVDTTVTFLPQDEKNALEIALFLRRKASALNPGSIDGSFDIPDIIATRSLRNALADAGFQEAVANILTLEKAQLVVGKLSTKFTIPWQSATIEVNEELASYLVSGGVLA